MQPPTLRPLHTLLGLILGALACIPGAGAVQFINQTPPNLAHASECRFSVAGFASRTADDVAFPIGNGQPWQITRVEAYLLTNVNPAAAQPQLEIYGPACVGPANASPLAVINAASFVDQGQTTVISGRTLTLYKATFGDNVSTLTTAAAGSKLWLAPGIRYTFSLNERAYCASFNYGGTPAGEGSYFRDTSSTSWTLVSATDAGFTDISITVDAFQPPANASIVNQLPADVAHGAPCQLTTVPISITSRAADDVLFPPGGAPWRITRVEAIILTNTVPGLGTPRLEVYAAPASGGGPANATPLYPFTSLQFIDQNQPTIISGRTLNTYKAIFGDGVATLFQADPGTKLWLAPGLLHTYSFTERAYCAAFNYGGASAGEGTYIMDNAHPTWSPITSVDPQFRDIALAVSGYQDPACLGQQPFITQQPASVVTLPGTSTSFTVAASSPSPLTYQWRRAGVNLVNGPTGYGSAINGTTSPTLTITAVAIPDDGSAFDCIVSNACGSTRSNPAGLGAANPCPADFNNSGNLSVADVFAFLNGWFAGCP